MATRLVGIGLGGIARAELKFARDIDGTEIIAGADVVEDPRDSFEETFDAPAYEDAQTMLAAHGDEADGAIIVTPHTLHYDQIHACFHHDVDVYVEKPMVTGIEEAVDVVDTAAEDDHLLQVGYQRHFHPEFRELKRIVDSGRIGDIHMVNCFLGQDWIAPQEGSDSWRVDPDLSGGGQLYDSGSHLIDVLLWVTDTEPKQVAALMDYRDNDVDVNSAVSATLDRDGRRVTASIGVSGDGPSSPGTYEGIVIWGTKGRIEYDMDEITVVEKDGTNRTAYSTEIAEGSDFDTLFTAKIENFVRSVEGAAELHVPGEVGLRVTALTEAAYRANENRETIDVDRLIDDARAARK